MGVRKRKPGVPCENAALDPGWRFGARCDLFLPCAVVGSDPRVDLENNYRDAACLVGEWRRRHWRLAPLPHR